MTLFLHPGDREYLFELIGKMAWWQLLEIQETINSLVAEGEKVWVEENDTE
jgi:hypothetical protein